MDRAVLESDPFRWVEGMLIAAYAIGATRGYVYCAPSTRWRSNACARPSASAAPPACSGATSSARSPTSTSPSTWARRRLRLRRGDGDPREHRGRRGMPRPRPHIPRQWPARLPHGAQQRRDAGQRAGRNRTTAPSGSAISGTGMRPAPRSSPSPVACAPGLVEVPAASPCARSSTTSAAAPPPATASRPCRSAVPAAAASRRVPRRRDRLRPPAGARRHDGLGRLVVRDERSCMVDVAKFFMEFIRGESCAKWHAVPRAPRACTRSSRSSPRGLWATSAAPGTVSRHPALEERAETVRETSLCASASPRRTRAEHAACSSATSTRPT